MPPPAAYKDWRYTAKALVVDRRAVRYSLAFYRQRGDWYDEIRYDSHERKRGRDVPAPHFHMKLRSGHKDSVDEAIEDIKAIIDNYLHKLEEAIR
ncbi:MAG: hypothetical protein DMG07_07560 [Acidobacteria bacterium]|nr:MAG: hypothetical protein DMG07_07560 [Acidobacteriota bacterium]